MIYIFDIDGTLADLTHRLHFIQRNPADWKSFYAACSQDEPIWDVIRVARELAKVAKIILITGRSDECKLTTIHWLLDNEVPFNGIYMRKEGDHRQDDIVKGELLIQMAWNFQGVPIAGVFEDRQQVVDMYRSKGFRVFQVAKGDF